MSNLKKATKQTFPKAFTPQELFADGSLGFAFDFRDPSLMFQDVGGSVPVEYGAPVGLVLDQSQGLRLSEELCHNGDFTKGEDGLEGWSRSSGTSGLTKSEGGVIFKSSPVSIGGYQSGVRYDIPVISQAFYVVEFDARYIAGGPLAVGHYYMEYINVMPQENGGKFKRYRCIVGAYITTVFNVNYIMFGAAEEARVSHWEINNVSIKRIYGNHAFQRTTTKRPILARSPRGGIRNLAVDSILSDPSKTTAYFSSSLNDQKLTFNGDGSVTTQALQDGNGSMGVKVLGYRETLKANTRYLVSIKAKASVGAKALGQSLRPFFNNPQPTLEEIENPGLSENYQRYVFALTFSAVNTLTLYISRKAASVHYSKGDELTFRDLQVELALPDQTEPTPYQKSNNLYDITEQGVPDDTYLLFDGVDDALQTGEIKFGDNNVKDVTVWAGVRKLGSNAVRTVVTSGVGVNSADTFIMAAHAGSADTAGVFFGIYPRTVMENAAGYKSPALMTLAGRTTQERQLVDLKINNTLEANLNPPAGVFTKIRNDKVFIGSRGNDKAYLQGHLSSLTVVTKSVDDQTLQQVEQYTNNRTGAY